MVFGRGEVSGEMWVESVRKERGADGMGEPVERTGGEDFLAGHATEDREYGAGEEGGDVRGVGTLSLAALDCGFHLLDYPG